MSIEPYYEDGVVTIYNGDARDVLPQLSAPDCVVTDPPYGIKYQGYNHGTVTGDENIDAVKWLIETWGDRPAVLTGANHFASLLPTIGVWSVWDKRTTEAADKMFGAPFELIWAAGNDAPGKIYRIQHGGVVNADGAGVKRVHPTQKPVKLMHRIIEDWAGPGCIVDPFAGSGSTLRAAKDLGRRAIGIELEEQHCEAAAQRMGQEVLDLWSAE